MKSIDTARALQFAQAALTIRCPKLSRLFFKMARAAWERSF